MDRTLPGLGSFYIVANRPNRRGVPTAAASGRSVVRMICKKDGKKLRVSLPEG